MRAYLRTSEGWTEFDTLTDAEEFTERYITIGKKVTIGNKVRLGNNVTLGNYVTLGNGVRLGNGVTLRDKVTLGDNVTLGDASTFLRNPLQIIGSRHLFNEYDNAGNIKIGCHVKHIDWWLENYQKVGEGEHYTKAEIEEYRLYLSLAKALMNREVE